MDAGYVWYLWNMARNIQKTFSRKLIEVVYQAYVWNDIRFTKPNAPGGWLIVKYHDPQSWPTHYFTPMSALL